MTKKQNLTLVFQFLVAFHLQPHHPKQISISTKTPNLSFRALNNNILKLIVGYNLYCKRRYE